MSDSVTVRFLDRTTAPHIATLTILAGVSAMIMNMFLPSLNNMAAHFDVPYSVIQLSVPVYLGASAILQIIIGPLSDKYGRRPVLLWGLSLFVVASFGCLIAPNIETFLFFRTMQACAAVAMVLSRAAIRDLYDENKSASMIGYVTMGMAVVPMASPAVGGLLDEIFGWRAVFWFFALAGIATWFLTFFDFRETARASDKTVWQQFREYPELLRSPRFWGYSSAAAFCSGSFFAYLGGAPFVGSELFGLSPAVLGMYFGAPAIGYAFGNYLTGRYAMKHGVNYLVLWGSIMNAAGVTLSLILFSIGQGTAFVFFGLMTCVGVGNGLVIPNATAGLLSVRPHLAGSASGLGGAIMIGGGAVLAAMAGALLTPETGAFPLLWIQTSTGVLALVSIATVYWREHRLGQAA